MIRQIVLDGIESKKFQVEMKPIDQVMLEQRAAMFTKRSIKKQSKLKALYETVRMIDLTTLEGADTPERVRQLCIKAKYPVTDHFRELLSNHEEFLDIPQVAAVCVYPSMVPYAAEYLQDTDIKIASVATGFPAGQLPLDIRLADVKRAVDFGADEIDMVINRGAFLSGRYQEVFDEIIAIKEACGEAHLKVILETGELGTYDKVQFASRLAIHAGADFIKTSTGKVSPAATLPVTLVMLNVIADHYDETGELIGMKPAGGIRTAKQAIHYLCMVNETLGSQWLTPDLFRFGASSLLNDVLKQIYKYYTGRYYYDRAYSMD